MVMGVWCYVALYSLYFTVCIAGLIDWLAVYVYPAIYE